MPVDQFLFTHCTFGSSFYERRVGKDSGLAKGYGPRSSSLPADRLSEVVQNVERLFHYNLPPGTPPEEKLRLDADTAPRRLLHVADSAGLQVVVQVCYRKEDTAGRAGSFFAHALVCDCVAGQSDWRPREAVALWAATMLRDQGHEAPFWYSEDSESLPFDLPGFESLDALIDSVHSRCVGDSVLGSFLQTEIGEEFADPAGLIPDRWKQRPVEQRRRFVKTLVSRFVEALESDVSLLLVAEPHFAALLFYAIMRSLSFPTAFPDESFSFSTFESDPNRLFTRLAAIPLAEGESSLNEALRVAHVVVDTFADDPGTGNRTGQNGLVELLASELDTGGWPQVDRAIDMIAGAEPESFAELGQLVDAYRDAGSLVAGRRDSTHHRSWLGVSAAESLFEREVIDRLLDQPEHSESWFGSRAHSESLELLGTVEFASLDSRGQHVVRSLMDNLITHDSLGAFPNLLKSTRLLSEYKVWMVCRVMQQDPGQPLPKTLGFLWEVTADELTADHVLAGVIARWMMKGGSRQLNALCQSVPDERLSVLLSAAAHGIRRREYKSELKGELEAWTEKGHNAMKRVLKHVPDTELCGFLNGPFAEAALGVWPKSGGELDHRLSLLAGSLVLKPSEFNSRIQALENVAAWGRKEHKQVADWKIVSLGLAILVRTDTKLINYEEFGEFRSAAKRLKLVPWRDSGRMKRLVRHLDKIAREVASADGDPAGPGTMVANIEPALVLVGVEWTAEKMTWDEFVSYNFGDDFSRRHLRVSKQIKNGMKTGDFRCRAAWDPRGWSATVKLMSLIVVAVLVVGTVSGLLLSGVGMSSGSDSGDAPGENSAAESENASGEEASEESP